jgi:chitodextrinase
MVGIDESKTLTQDVVTDEGGSSGEVRGWESLGLGRKVPAEQKWSRGDGPHSEDP